jgi:hypothetical protein
MSLYAGLFDDAPVTEAPAQPAESTIDETPAASSEAPAKNWSASLGFQPVLRKKPAKAAMKPVAAAIISAAPVVYAPEPVTAKVEADDVNGFRATQAGQKASNRSQRKVSLLY